MTKQVRFLTQAAIIAALYAVLTHMQNLLVPGSATWMIQMRMSEALCVLAFFTPAAIPGLTLGCLVFNITYAAALPLDFVIGSAATFAAAEIMWLTRKVTIKGYPLLGMLMPALSNAILVGWSCRCTSAAASGSMRCMWPWEKRRCCWFWEAFCTTP